MGDKKKYLQKKIGAFLYRMLGLIKYSEFLYFLKMKEKIDLKNPQKFNEKLMWLKIYTQNPLKSQCADKYAVRDYLIKKGEGACLNKLYGVYDSSKEINWDELPHAFVLKVNNASGAIIVCEDKETLNREATSKKIDRWLKENYYTYYAEPHYQAIPPQLICEKYLKSGTHSVPVDYKFYCFDGIPKVMMMCVQRETGHPKFYLCDLEGTILPYNQAGKEALKEGIYKVELPATISEMCRISKNLASEFPFVRMDYYEINGAVVFGEMTFTPSACLDSNLHLEGELEMGEMINLPIQI